MPDVAKITVVQKRQNRFISILILTTFWIILIGAIGISRTWLGGSFIVEAIAAVFSVAVLVAMAKHNIGIEVTMTPAELRQWLDAGSPADVKEWRAASAAKVVS